MPVNGADGMETVIREHLSDFDTVMNVPAEARDLAQALRDAGYGHVAAAKAEALRDAAEVWQIGGWSDTLLPKPTPPAVPVIAYSNRVLDWLRARADWIEGHEAEARAEATQ